VELHGIFTPVQNKPKYPQTESECGCQEVFVKFLYRNARYILRVLRHTLH
jgi:hypothetical protein